MKVVVTGGRGLLGTAVVRELVAQGHDLTVIQRSPAGHGSAVREVLGDVTDAAAVAGALSGADSVVHLAARVSMVGPWAEFERVNVDGTRVVIEEAKSAGVGRFVHISSPSVAHAGEPLVGVSAMTADPESARSNYARSKAMAELIALEADAPGFAVTALRPHLVWGPGDTQLVGRVVERARSGRLVLIDDGAALIDTTYIDNAADAITHALTRCDSDGVHGRAFVVSNGEPRTVAEILGLIAAAAGAAAPTRHVPFRIARAAGSVIERAWQRAGRAGEPPLTAFVAEQLATAHWFDQRQTRAALDWAPRVSLDEGFRRLAQSL